MVLCPEISVDLSGVQGSRQLGTYDPYALRKASHGVGFLSALSSLTVVTLGRSFGVVFSVAVAEVLLPQPPFRFSEAHDPQELR